jgi:hypothetical protein
MVVDVYSDVDLLIHSNSNSSVDSDVDFHGDSNVWPVACPSE